MSQSTDGVFTFAGRLKRFVKLGGEMISLPAIEEVLLRNQHLCAQYQIVVSRAHNLDELDVHVELKPDHAAEIGEGQRSDIARDVAHHIKSFIGVSARIRVVDPGAIERVVVGKAKRVIDNRQK